MRKPSLVRLDGRMIMSENNHEEIEERMLENLAFEDLPKELDPDQAEEYLCKWCDREIFGGPSVWHDRDGFESCRLRVSHFHEPKPKLDIHHRCNIYSDTIPEGAEYPEQELTLLEDKDAPK